MTENPLTEEQIEELNEIVKLPQEEQQKKLPKFLQKLNKEQVEFLKKQQGNGCVFCSIVEGKILAKKVYEDTYVMAVLDINPANKGHVILFPKYHFEILSLIKDVGHLFNIANKISSAVFEVTKAEGTNIFVANGVVAGQRVNHVLVHIIPRFNNDKVNFTWDKINVNEEEINNIAKKISEALRNKLEIKKEELENKIEEKSFKYQRRIP